MTKFYEYLAAFIDLFYPRLCGVCKETLTTGEKHICTKCLSDFPYDNDHHDDLLLQFSECCEIDSIYTLFSYHRFGKFRNLIHAIKYQSQKKLAITLGEMLGRRIPSKAGIDLLLYLPLHPKREKRRGYNQSELIARGIANVLHIPLAHATVQRVINNPSQTGLTREERMANVQHIFRLQTPEPLVGRHILIIDDVVTTGSTISSLLQELQAIPRLRVSITCLARAKNG